MPATSAAVRPPARPCTFHVDLGARNEEEHAHADLANTEIGSVSDASSNVPARIMTPRMSSQMYRSGNALKVQRRQ